MGKVKIKVNKKRLKKLSISDLKILREMAKENYKDSHNDEVMKVISESIMTATKYELNRRTLKIWSII